MDLYFDLYIVGTGTPSENSTFKNEDGDFFPYCRVKN